MSLTLKNKFYIAGKKIGKALDISARLNEIIADEDNYDIVFESGYVNIPRENEYWGAFRVIFGRILPAIFVWPILTPLIIIFIILPMQILYHSVTALVSAAATLVGMAISGFKWLLSPKTANNDVTTAASTDNTQRAGSLTGATNVIGENFNSLTFSSVKKKSNEEPCLGENKKKSPQCCFM